MLNPDDTGPLRADRELKARQVYHQMIHAFNEDELRELCMDFRLDFENLIGDTKNAKIAYLVDHFLRRKTLDVLINWLTGIRPNHKWPDTRIESSTMPHEQRLDSPHSQDSQD